MNPAEENVSLRQLDIFCRVAEMGSFSKAAASIYLSQPTVSEHVATLEKLLGARLFDRVGRKVELTSAGQLYYKYARRIIDLRSEAQQAIDSFLGLVHGSLLIGASTIPGTYILPKIVGSFARKYPSIQTSIVAADSGEIIEQLAERKLEIGFVGKKPRGKIFSVREIAGDRLLVAVPPGHKWKAKKTVSLEELRREPFLLREQGSGTRSAFEEALAKKGVSLGRDFNVVAVLGSTEAIKEAIREGLGVSVISDLAVGGDCERCKLKTLRIKGISIEREFYRVYLKHHSLAPAAEAFLAHLGEVGKERSY